VIDVRQTNRIWWALIGLTAFCLVAFNYYCVPAHDELAYCWLGLSTPRWGDCPRADSLAALINQQIVGYNHDWSGRVFVHFVVGCFSGFGLHTLFDFCNAGMMLLLVGLMLLESGMRITPRNFFYGFCLVFLFMWQADTFCRDAAFAVNYLWMCCFTICIMRLWRRIRSWWLVPLFFIYGWSQESFVPSMVVALPVAVVWRSVAERRAAVNRYQVAGWLLMVVGCYYLCTAPAALERAGRMAGSNTLMTFLFGMVKNWTAFLLGIWPAVLILALVALLLRNGNRFFPFVTRDIEWWLFTGAALGSYTILGSNGFHIACPFLLGATVLGFICREALPSAARRVVMPLCVFSFVFFVVATVLQVIVGQDHKRALALYVADSQGISYRHPYVLGPFASSVRQAHYDRWAASLFRRQFGKTVDPAFLSEDLYCNLYLDPAKFFAKAKRLDGTDLYQSPDTPSCWVKVGNEELTVAEQHAVRALTSSGEMRGIKRCPKWIPGRILLMLPARDALFATPSDAFSITAKDGKVYTIYKMGED